MDAGGERALCCAPGEGCRGHNEIRDVVFDLTIVADATAEREVSGLLETAPGLRPADILTSAVSQSLASALDFGVAARPAVHAGDDCCETKRLRKVDKYRDYLTDFDLQGSEYKPLIWSLNRTELQTNDLFFLK